MKRKTKFITKEGGEEQGKTLFAGLTGSRRKNRGRKKGLLHGNAQKGGGGERTMG